MNSSLEVWTMVLSLLKQELPDTVVDTWFNDTIPLELSEKQLVLEIPTQLKYSIISNRYTDYINKALYTLFGTPMTTQLQLKQNPSPILPGAGPLESAFTFDSFVVGSSNQFAFQAATAVAGKPGYIYNPLFIYGPSGLGKTHLLYSIVNRIKITHPQLRICYVKGDQFTNELIQAIGQGTTAQFRERYRECDLLLMDDVQFIAGKDQTQVEFFHTFNTLYESNKQIVLTADRPPNELRHLEDRLCTRFQQGLLADIQPPDYETRMAIIKNKASSMGLDLPDSLAEYIAENITANVRQLEGTVRKILAYQELMGSHLDIDTVIRVIRDLIEEDKNILPTPDEIIEETAKFYGLDPREIRGSSRAKEVTIARQVSMYLIRHVARRSLKEVGRPFDRDHTTAMHAIKKVESMIEAKHPIAEIIKDITTNLNDRRY